MAGSTHRTKTFVSKRRLQDYGWTSIHEHVFDSLKHLIANATQLAYPDPDKYQCNYKDASTLHSVGMITQISPSDLAKPHSEQAHVPLGFCGHHFSGSELN